MSAEHEHARPPRTVLENKIRERRQTLEEFADYAEQFAREHGEPGTLSVRHLKRLVAGQGTHGQPLGRPRPATARLLERIFDMSIDKLLSPPTPAQDEHDDERELRRMLHTAARIDGTALDLLREQLNATRRLDRQLGAPIAHDEVLTKTRQVTQLLHHSLTPATRSQLAALLSELCSLAGWQALDMGQMRTAWQHYERGRMAVSETEQPAYRAHTIAGQAFVLIDLGDTTNAATLLATTREHTGRTTSPLMRAWLAAAHGETLAADGQPHASMHAFDQAHALLPRDLGDTEGPYVALDPIHLARWRGNALARTSNLGATDVLSTALRQLDPTFTRAETALHADIATAYTALTDHERAAYHARRAEQLATEIGSTRQQRRISAFGALPA
ncbi:hypothetical protein H0B56_14330 [Haloechinothrix sp. YIM 98757]|uniref:Uncharacterized protein n=1 Tax=Haloechinothrix aidingensis TaxID=2752311 RepID=A0A838ABW3_9PSEU|nr:hypothetical protein [Haloechinothrix aidingensis]MBA0126726.1 hypothetical protein [Haloechinothrix aidingensis]